MNFMALIVFAIAWAVAFLVIVAVMQVRKAVLDGNRKRAEHKVEWELWEQHGRRFQADAPNKGGVREGSRRIDLK